MTEVRKDIVSLNFNELASLIKELGEPALKDHQFQKLWKWQGRIQLPVILLSLCLSSMMVMS